MRMVDMIQKKRDGGELSDQEIQGIIQGYTDGSIPDYQMSAFAMAVFFRGMSGHETASLTRAMAQSGDAVDLSRFGNLSVDKHSTGGVGDKTTLIVAPVVAALGGKVAKMTGRGLGFTGGTADKLESIPGFVTTLPIDTFLKQVEEIGIAVVSQSADLSPADKKLYALRDVTATVESIPLIASSIMSKKLAAGAHSIVLDVKVGSGAFCKTMERAEALATEMIGIGKASGRRVAAVITDMDVPLGHAVGNALEVQEAIRVLRGEHYPDLRAVCTELAATMLSLCRGWDLAESKERVTTAIDGGAALEKFREWIARQGGDTSCIDDFSHFPQAPFTREVYAPQTGYVATMDAGRIGGICVALGAGRARKGDAIDPAAGIFLHKKTGDFVRAGERIATLYAGSNDRLFEAEKEFPHALRWSAAAQEPHPLIYKTLQ